MSAQPLLDWWTVGHAILGAVLGYTLRKFWYVVAIVLGWEIFERFSGWLPTREHLLNSGLDIGVGLLAAWIVFRRRDRLEESLEG